MPKHNIYTNARMTAQIQETRKQIGIKGEVRNANSIPKFLTLALEESSKKWNENGINTNGKKLNHRR